MGLLSKPKRHKLSTLIGSASKAVSDSYSHTTKSALDYIQEGLDNKNPKTLDFSIGQKDFHFPLLSLYPPPALTIKNATITIKTSIVDIDEDGEIITEEHGNNNNTTISFTLDNEDSTQAHSQLTKLYNLGDKDASS